MIFFMGAACAADANSTDDIAICEDLNESSLQVVDDVEQEDDCDVLSNSTEGEYLDPSEGFKYLNEYRSEKGVWYWNEDNVTVTYFNTNDDNILKPYVWDSELEAAAKIRAMELSQRASHTRPDGTDWDTIYPRSPDFGSTSECIMWGHTGTGAIDAWKEVADPYDTQDHRRGLLSPYLNCAALAGYEVKGTMYWVLSLARRHSLINNTPITPHNQTLLPNQKTLSDLNNLIIAGKEIKLKNDYVYVESEDSAIRDGITIANYVTIDGQGHTIDGSNRAKIFKIVSDNVVLKNIRIINANTYDSKGSAIFSTGHGVSIINCTFINNVAYDGTIYLSDAIACLSHCHFEDNLAANGGAIYLSNSQASVLNSSFVNNDAILYGGAIYSNMANLSVEKSSFVNAFATFKGGAIYSINSSMNISKSNFSGNLANDKGGAINLEDSNASVEGSSFTDNMAYAPIDFMKNFGGAINSVKSRLSIVNSSFARNAAKTNGMVANHATYGGAVYMDNSNASLLNSSFAENYVFSKGSAYGGAVYLTGSSISAAGCGFIENRADKYAGAIYSSESKFFLSGCGFINNTATDEGGAIYSVKSDALVEKCGFINNTLHSWGLGNGGAICFYDSTNCLVTGSSFVGNIIYSKWYGYGGAICNYHSSNISIVGSHFINNILNSTYSAYGAAICCHSSSNSSVSDSVFINNLNHNYKDAIDGFYDTSISVSDSIFDKNSLSRLSRVIEPINCSTVPDTYKIKTKMELDVLTHLESAIITVTTSDCIYGHAIVKVGAGEYGVDVINGRGVLRLDNLSAQTYNVYAVLSNEYYESSANSSFEIDSRETSIIAEDFVTYAKSKELLFVRLVDAKGNPIAGRHIVLNAINKNFTILTNSNGYANRSINLNVGSYDCIVSFKGDESYFASKTSIKIIVRSKIDISSNISCFANNATVSLNLSKPIDSTVIVTVNGRDKYNVNIVGGSGKLSLYNLNNGNYSLDYTLVDENYAVSRDSSLKFEIGYYRTEFIASDFITNELSGEKFKVTLIDENGRPVLNKTVKFIVNNKTYTKKTNSKGQASIAVKMAGGDYVFLICFDGDEKYMPVAVSKNVKVKTNVSAQLLIEKISDDVVIKVNLSKKINLGVILTVNNKNHTLNIISGYGTLKLDNLSNGNYTVECISNDFDYNLKKAQSQFFINLTGTKIIAGDFESFYKSNEAYIITLLDFNNTPIPGKTVKCTIRDLILENVTDNNGEAIFVFDLGIGDNDADISFNGDDVFRQSDLVRKILIKSTFSSVSISKSQLSTVLVDSRGMPLRNVMVTIQINGKNQSIKTDADGMVKIEFDNLAIGKNRIMVINPDTGEQFTHTISISIKICENRDLIKYYTNNKAFKVRILSNGKPVREGYKVSFKISGKNIQTKTDKNGYASLRVSLKPGTYRVTVTCGDASAKNMIKIKPFLITKNVKVKKGRKGTFKVKLLNNKGKILPKKSIKIKFKGKMYKIKTNKRGIAVFEIPKNIKAGKYTIKTSYGKFNVKNRITVKS